MKFTQLVCAQWEGKDNKLTYSLYAIGEDGNVYRNTKKGWQNLESIQFDQEKKGYWAKRHAKNAKQEQIDAL